MAYRSLIRQILNGDAVDASSVNTPAQQLLQNTNYLKELFEAAFIGQAVILHEQTVAETVLTGQAVYFNDATQQFEAALVALENDLVTTAASANCWGLVKQKTAGNKADIVVGGVTDVDLSAAITGTISAGAYYLSAAQAGKLTKTAPMVPVPVCLVGAEQTTGVHTVLVRPDIRDALESHRHYQYELVCLETADAAVEGWLAADEFTDVVPPDGAAYGYTIAASQFAGLWPPVPIEGAYLEWQTGTDSALYGMGVPAGTSASDLVRFTADGIWWMSDCASEAPFTTADSLSVSEDCPREPQMRMTLYFSRPTFWSADTAVLSLHVANGTPLDVYCQSDMLDATTGHLEIDLDVEALVATDDDTAGATVLKGVYGKTLTRGPVVEGIKAGSANVSLTSDLGALPESGVAQGIVTISVDSSVSGAELAVQTVRVDGVTDELYEDVIALAFPSDLDSEFRARVYVPGSVALPEGTQLKFRFRLMGRAAGDIPDDAFELTYRRIPRPSALLTAVELPTTDTTLTFDTTMSLDTADNYFDVESAAFDIAAGDIVLFTLRRPGTDDYAADIYVLEKHAVLV